MRTWDMSKAAETIAAIIRRRSQDAEVSMSLAFGTLRLLATWKRGRLPDVRMDVRFTGGDEDARTAEVTTAWGATESTTAGAVAFGRLLSDVAAVACEIEALTTGCAFTTGETK